MKFSTKGKYGLIAMAYLSKYYNSKNSKFISLNEISKKNNISEAYLEHLIRKLKKAGFIKTKRGILGGYCLSVSPTKIIVSDLLLALEGPLDICRCNNKINKCNIFKTCVSRFLGEKIQIKINELITNITLNDLIKK